MSVLMSALGWVRRVLIPRPKAFRVIMTGGSEEWREALAPGGPAWRGINQVGAVRFGDSKEGVRALRLVRGRRDLLLPLKERDIIEAPRGAWALVPGKRTVAMLGDKQRFADHLTRRGMGDLLPRHYPSPEEAEFPCVVKRRRSAGSSGVRVAGSREELDAILAEPRFAGRKVLLQERLETDVDEVGYFVLVRGRIVWHCGYRYMLPEPGMIRAPRMELPVERCRLSPEDLDVFERVLAPLHYNGPANADFKRRPDGSLQLLEINPRLGGSLMLPRNVEDLRGALTAIAEHARWRGSELVVDTIGRWRRPVPKRVAAPAIGEQPLPQ